MEKLLQDCLKGNCMKTAERESKSNWCSKGLRMLGMQPAGRTSCADCHITEILSSWTQLPMGCQSRTAWKGKTSLMWRHFAVILQPNAETSHPGAAFNYCVVKWTLNNQSWVSNWRDNWKIYLGSKNATRVTVTQASWIERNQQKSF